MLPFSLKVVWFCLSFSGMIASWVVLPAFARAIGCHWVICYSVFTTLLEGAFCLGMIYDMNPFRMPRVFCVVQCFVIYYSAWSLTGACAAFTFATAGSVLWPSFNTGPDASTVIWKNKYYFPIVVYPLACLSIALPVLLRTDAIRPTDDLHCDASNPEWGRFLGYAGLPMILAIPCFFISAAAARRVIRLHLKSQQSRWTGQFPLESDRSHEQNVAWEGLSGPVVSSPDAKTSISVTPDIPHYLPSKEDGPQATLSIDPDVSPSTTIGVLSSTLKRPETWEAMSATEEQGKVFYPQGQMGSLMMTSTMRAEPPAAPNLAPAIWRLILFQMAFFIVECLAAVSTIIDIALRRPTPTPFGSQHVALILVGWGPVFVLGHLPAVRRELMFWKK